MSRSDLVDVEVRVIHTTDHAVLVRSAITGKQAWVPLSRCEVTSGARNSHIITLSEGVAIEKELV